MGWASASLAEIRMVLSGWRESLVGVEAVTGAVAGLKREVHEYGETATVSTKRSWAMNQALFTMRRYAYMGTLAITGMAVAGLKMGYDFNSAMQSATTALLPVMHGTGAVRGELEKLFNIAKYSPFQFKDITTSFRAMYLAMQPLGISAQTVTTTIQSMIDGLSATGRTSPMQLNRVAVALQHMAYQGRLTGFTVNQLARDGIPIFGALSKELGVTGDQLHNISKLGIPAQTVLDAINKYIETTPGYMNAARRQAGTLHGQLTTLKDDIAQTFGALTLRQFQGTSRGVLPSLLHMFDGISAIIVKQKGRISLDQVFGVVTKDFPWMKPFLEFFKQGVQVIKIFWNIIKNGLLPTLYILVSVFEFFSPITNLVLRALKFLTKQSWLLVPVTTLLIGLYVIDRLVMWRAAMMKKKLADMTWLEATLTKKTFTMKKLDVFWTMMQAKATRMYGILMGKIWVKEGAGAYKSLTGIEKAVRSLGIAIRTQLIPALVDFGAASYAFLATPAGWILLIVAAVILLVTGLVILYFKWKWFHNLVNTTFHWIWEHWKLMAVVLMLIAPILGLLLITARLLYDHWHSLKKLLDDLYNLTLKPIYNWLNRMWNDLVGRLSKYWQDILDVVKAITGWFTGMIGWINKAIKKIEQLLGLWKKIPGATWIVGAVKGVAGAVGSAATSVWNQPGIGRPADSGSIPTAQSQIAAALASGNAANTKIHTTIHNHVHIDGKQVATSVAKHNQKAKARG